MADPYILTEKEFRLYDLFFASLATSLGFGVTIIFWLRGRNKNNAPELDKYLKEKYGKEYDEYAGKTKMLIPFIY